MAELQGEPTSLSSGVEGPLSNGPGDMDKIAPTSVHLCVGA